MGYIELCFILSALVTTTYQMISYRLPNDTIPYHYKIKVIPHIIPTKFTFDGEVEIHVKILYPVKNLTLHSLDLEVHEERTTLLGDEEIVVPHKHIFEEETQFLILHFRNPIYPGDYILRLEYSGYFNDQPTGFFRDSYVDSSNKTVYLVATQFETTYARKVFPCWDEPALKATFDISIKHFPNYTALSNMPVERIINEMEIDGKIWTDFETTPLMSTFIVCFVVSDFKSITNRHANFSVWSRKNALDSTEAVYNFGLQALHILEKYTNISYELPKMDIISIPGYVTGAMENWGLIVAGEHNSLLNYNSSKGDVIKAAQVMVHEMTHQWFGNLVTPDWWSHIWLTEGLASYLHHILTAEMMNVPKLREIFVAYNNFDVFETDANPLTLPLFRDVNSANECQQLLNTIHSKASTMMHMLIGLINEDVFQAGLRKILHKYKFKSITSDDFWNAMQDSMNEAKLPFSNFDIKTVMDPYISQVGYPVVNVVRDYSTGEIKLTQECLVCQNNNKTESKWWIPINFATSSALNFSSTFATHWMDPEERELIIKGVDPSDWIIINIQSSAYYRVNYDERNWYRLVDYMNSDGFSNIHIINRAQLSEDALYLYKQQKLDRNLLVSISSYLGQEVDSIPWFPGFKIMDHLLETTKDIEKFKSFALHLVDAVLNDAGVEAKPDDDFFTTYKRFEAIYFTCRLAKINCKYLRW